MVSSANDQGSELPSSTAGERSVADIAIAHAQSVENMCVNNNALISDAAIGWVRAEIFSAVGDERRRNNEKYAQNIRDGWNALAMIREAVESVAPAGSVPRSEYLDEPTPFHEALAIIKGVAAMRAQIDEAIGCFQAAYAEGLADALAAQDDTRPGWLYDLVRRRLLPAHDALMVAPAVPPESGQVWEIADETK